jgi:hypothetical protein
MYERLLNKSVMPDEVAIQDHLEPQSCCRLIIFENLLKANYQLVRELKFPFGNNYGWGYKYSHKLTHLCYVFFEKNAFMVMLQIGDKQVSLLESQISLFLRKTQELWENRYRCGEHGGWIHYRVLTDEELADVVKLIEIRKKPSIK